MTTELNTNPGYNFCHTQIQERGICAGASSSLLKCVCLCVEFTRIAPRRCRGWISLPLIHTSPSLQTRLWIYFSLLYSYFEYITQTLTLQPNSSNPNFTPPSSTLGEEKEWSNRSPGYFFSYVLESVIISYHYCSIYNYFECVNSVGINTVCSLK